MHVRKAEGPIAPLSEIGEILSNVPLFQKNKSRIALSYPNRVVAAPRSTLPLEAAVAREEGNAESRNRGVGVSLQHEEGCTAAAVEMSITYKLVLEE